MRDTKYPEAIILTLSSGRDLGSGFAHLLPDVSGSGDRSTPTFDAAQNVMICGLLVPRAF